MVRCHQGWLAAAASALAVLLAAAMFNDSDQDDPPDSTMEGLMALARRIAATDDGRLPPLLRQLTRGVGEASARTPDVHPRALLDLAVPVFKRLDLVLTNEGGTLAATPSPSLLQPTRDALVALARWCPPGPAWKYVPDRALAHASLWHGAVAKRMWHGEAPAFSAATPLINAVASTTGAARTSLEGATADLGAALEASVEPVLVVDNWLPTKVVAALRDGIMRNPYLRAERVSGHSSTFRVDVDSPPETLIDQLVAHYRAGLPESARARLRGAEWWVHSRGSLLGSDGQNFHFDTELASRNHRGVWHAPILSTVLYVEAEGGPTVVANLSVAESHRRATHPPGEHAVPSDALRGDGRAWVVPAVANRVLWFDGGLLHGVLPAAIEPPPERGSEPGHAPRRTTLMIGLSERPCDAQAGGSRARGGTSLFCADYRRRAEWKMAESFPLSDELPVGVAAGRSEEEAPGLRRAVAPTPVAGAFVRRA